MSEHVGYCAGRTDVKYWEHVEDTYSHLLPRYEWFPLFDLRLNGHRELRGILICNVSTPTLSQYPPPPPQKKKKEQKKRTKTHTHAHLYTPTHTHPPTRAQTPTHPVIHTHTHTHTHPHPHTHTHPPTPTHTPVLPHLISRN